jgi:hypothetical protein
MSLLRSQFGTTWVNALTNVGGVNNARKGRGPNGSLHTRLTKTQYTGIDNASFIQTGGTRVRVSKTDTRPVCIVRACADRQLIGRRYGRSALS